MKSKITEVTGIKKDEMQAAIEQLKRTMPQMLERAKLVAQIRKSFYDEHLSAGFTPEQALELCKSIAL